MPIDVSFAEIIDVESNSPKLTTTSDDAGVSSPTNEIPSQISLSFTNSSEHLCSTGSL